MNRKMKKLSISLCMACLTGIMAAGCTEETDSDKHLPDGKYPMTFTAAVDGLTVTRAGTADGEWATTDRIAVQVSNAESGNEIKIYAPSKIDGKSATLTSDDPFYWQRNNETKTVSAWYCGDGSTASEGENAEKVPTKWSVQPDQNKDEGKGYQESDFLYAAPKDISFSGTDKSLEFIHQTARVVINIKNAEAATDAGSITKVTIGYDSNLALSGTYIAPTEGNATGAWNISNGTMGTITPKDITASSSSSDILKTYAALVIPQNMSDQKFIAVTLTDNNTYYYTPHNMDADLKSGTQYTYNITVKHGYLEVMTVKTGGTWGGGEETTNVTSKILKKGFTADDLKIGDYYYSDGKSSDGGYRKYTDDSFVVLDIKPVLTDPSTGAERTCIGIVYWVGDITGEDPLLKRDKPNCTHGLIVSLWDMPGPDNSDEVTMTWTYGDSEFVNDWLGSDVTWTERPDGFTSIQIDNKMQGYANTIALKEYNKYVESKSEDGYGPEGNKRVKPVKGLDAFQNSHPAPSNSSGWYWPSIEELRYVCWGQGNGEGTTGKDMLNTQIGKVSGSNVFGNLYWSSTESSRDSRNAWYVYFYDGRVDYSGGKYYHTFRVRPLLAF